MATTPPTNHTPSQFDAYIIERIIRALELVTEMGAKLAIMERTTDRHERVLESGPDSLPMQVRLLREAVDDLELAWKERGKHTWDFRLAIIVGGISLVVSIFTALVTKWVGG